MISLWCSYNFRKAKSIKKKIREIIIQGNNNEIQKLFTEIVNATKDEFREDNDPTIASFLINNLFNAFTFKDINNREAIKNAMISELNKI